MFESSGKEMSCWQTSEHTQRPGFHMDVTTFGVLRREAAQYPNKNGYSFYCGTYHSDVQEALCGLGVGGMMRRWRCSSLAGSLCYGGMTPVRSDSFFSYSC